MFLRLNWVVERARPDHRETDDAHLKSARRTRLRPNLAGQMDRCLEAQLLEAIPDLRRQLCLDENRLHDASSVPDHSERDFSR